MSKMYATSLLLAIILTRVNAYSRALASTRDIALERYCISIVFVVSGAVESFS